MPAVTTPIKTQTVALIGNPNTGKSTLFTALAGVRQRVGNYPGVTVEKKVGHVDVGHQRFALVDLPGTYSLAPRSPDEMVAVDVLLGRQSGFAPADAVICIVDASNLERNLYLVSQVLELGLPTVVALNMIDLATERGMTIDVGKLSERLRVPVVEVQANRRRGIDKLKAALGEVVRSPRERCGESPLPAPFRREAADLEQWLSTKRDRNSDEKPWPRYLVERLLLDTSGYLEQAAPSGGNGELGARLTAARGRLAEANVPVPAVEAMARYQWIGGILEGVLGRPAERPASATDRLDRILTSRVWGTLVFALLMLVVFSSIFIAAKPLMGMIDGGVKWLGDRVDTAMPPGALQSLLSKGVIAGAGSVIVFLPQILILFGFIGILEDCGYMARAAYLMDRLMVRVGLSGKSFIPLLSSFACAIPGVMATRVIENRRDRLTTILVAPLMSCSARLPVYTLLIGAFIPARTYLGGWLGLQGLTLFAMYLVGIVAAVFVALVLKKTLLRGATPPFVMELPPYKFPSLRIVAHRMFERGWSFVRRAGTLIVAVAIVVWALLYFPHDPAKVADDLRIRQAEHERQLAALDSRTTLSPLMRPAGAGARGRGEGDEVQNDSTTDTQRATLAAELARFQDPIEREKLEAGAYQRRSVLAGMGRWIEPAVRPLGWDWRIGCAAIASFPAREVVLGTLGVIYNLGEDVDIHEREGQTQLQAELRRATWDGTNRPVFTVPVALSLMVFFALCAQCAATLAVIKRETNSWRWPIFTFAYMTVLAYLGALATYQIGTWIGS
jgi:ferrous iron transport protein B